LPVLQVNSRSIDQKSGEIWTAQADLQPISFKSDRLLVGRRMKALVKTRPEPGIWPGSVPILAQLVNGMRRVCKPGGEIYIVNHYQHASPVVSAIERMMAPFPSLMGFHPDFSMEHLAVADFLGR